MIKSGAEMCRIFEKENIYMNSKLKIVFIALLSVFVICSCQKSDKNKIVLQARTTVTEINESDEKIDGEMSATDNDVVPKIKTEEKTSNEERNKIEETNADSEISETEKEVANSTEAVIVQAEESVNETTANGSIQLLEKSDKVKNGSEATLKIKGKSNTEYSIKVIYSSGASKAKGLENKVSDENGCVSWTWKVGAKTTEGEHEITVSGGGESIKTTFVTYK